MYDALCLRRLAQASVAAARVGTADYMQTKPRRIPFDPIRSSISLSLVESIQLFHLILSSALTLFCRAFADCTLDGDASSLYYAAAAIMHLQHEFGLIPRIQVGAT
jgi:hypothetical protein